MINLQTKYRYNTYNESNADDKLVVAYDMNDKIIGFNAQCEQLTGYTFENIKGQRIQDRLLLSGEHYSGENYKSGNAEHATNQYSNCWQARNGNKLDINWTNQLLGDGTHNFTHIVATGTPVKKQAETIVSQETNLEQQDIINNLLFIAMEDITLDDKLNRCLGNIKTSSWISDDAKVDVFMLHNDRGLTKLKTQLELDNGIQLKDFEYQQRIAICQKTINTGHSSFNTNITPVENSNNTISNTYYSIPIKSGNKVLAILAIQVKRSHIQDIREIFFLRTAANVLTIILDQHRLNHYNLQSNSLATKTANN